MLPRIASWPKIRKSNFILLIVLFFISTPARSQREAENWIFGWNNWANFSSGQPVFQQQVPTALQNASVSVSNKNGQLLFYGSTPFIYDRLHQQMPGVGVVGLMPDLDKKKETSRRCL